ncbi:CDP-diacylglycerol--serine O-phosphatidyltransferase [Telluria mixta]|uniref:CDP-diacylglycerol--serine O-phosphatidyltransferase n=1 Tax=Telluria mixta TaxID=34071 RepID=A0ABT2C8H1_9BURK|nr:CDP-diacylglycerol--serine O-phosphatidyltransferase [Telluria mixta]MCS0633700.1 CDP-diacylglycerol--serine O-phosphatidyltransferase [Telluria mixta]WEM98120.1 CDP-diacylglycerol--serine O-phosphatidyltransferase [Telluria mixta]
MTPTRQQRLARAKFALPSFVTLLSIACGFGSIVISVDNAPVGDPSDYRLAAILLVLAGVFDALDGFVARATNTQSAFGVQLDSIADVMNFGCAPGLLLYCYGFAQMGAAHPTLVRMGGLACFVFVACGALRLARFNVMVGKTDPRYFVGMPITAGAACVASVVVAWPDPVADMAGAFLVMLLMVAVGTLMVSTIRFPSSKQPKSKAALVALVVCIVLLALLRSRFFALFFVFYISATLLLNIAWMGGWTKIAPPKVYDDEAVD